ncbi:MAG TPA: hypothetical protein EYP98_19950, partial [Planctomycetes bacterium]|nr:hypothetical protein [Planctomycetota bacterium]
MEAGCSRPSRSLATARHADGPGRSEQCRSRTPRDHGWTDCCLGSLGEALRRVAVALPASLRVTAVGRLRPSIAKPRTDSYCPGVKIYISADMEGVAGVVTDAQLGPEGFAWRDACELYTEEVLAVIDELRSAGATDITVSDSHGTGLNLKIERMPAGVRLVQSWPRRLGMMEGIDASYDGAILLGYHAGSHNPRGVRAHTMSSANVFDVALNGAKVCEAELSGYIAAHFKVPILMLSGDDAICAEIAASL